MTHGVDHDMPDFDISMLQTIVDDNKVDDSQGVDMESEEEDDDDIEMPEYVDCSDIMMTIMVKGMKTWTDPSLL